MGLCLQCKNWVKQPEKKREKKFCNDTCRSNYRHAKNRKKQAKTSQATPIIKEAKEVVQKGIDEWVAEIDQVDDVTALERIGKQIERCSLSGRDKQWLHNYGQQVYQNKFSY
jgi:hypothetical protein